MRTAVLVVLALSVSKVIWSGMLSICRPVVTRVRLRMECIRGHGEASVEWPMANTQTASLKRQLRSFRRFRSPGGL